jgi:hypothetical protein
MLSPEEMRGLVRRHISLWKKGTHAEWRACFSEGYEIEDPVGTGLRPMGSYADEWDNMHSDLHLDMEAYRLIVGGREVLADLRAVTHLGPGSRGPAVENGARHTLSYTGIYTVGEEGLLTANRTFADPVSEELWKAFYPTLPSPAEREPPPCTPDEVRQAIEDHLYFWNVGTHEAWRGCFSADAQLEDPVGSGARPLGTGRAIWDAGHVEGRRVLRGSHRVIVCEMEALAQTVESIESGAGARTVANAEIFAFDADGRIRSWRVFRDD